MCATKSHSEMLSQVSVEAVYSASYVENYLDCVENLPNDLQRMISRMRELDVNYLVHVRESQKQTELWKSTDGENASKMMRIFRKLQKALIAAQELGDEKMHLLQAIQDKIENKTRHLDHDFKNLDFGKEEPAPVESKEPAPVAVVANTTTVSSTVTSTTVEKPTKRARRSRHETFSGLDSNQNDNGQAEHVLRSQVTTSANNSAKKNAGAGKKKKRKSRQNHREETPPKEEEPSIDHDEPTYCLCDQISFGEMIMCDNDLCPIEWFHFSCVSLSTKPKGKWYCPKCRGDRPNAMKPKAQFLKELERYNKEKEEKT